VWDLTATDPQSTTKVLRGHEEAISCLSISPDGWWLVTASTDGTARIWPLRLEDLKESAWQTVARGPSPDEVAQYQFDLDQTDLDQHCSIARRAFTEAYFEHWAKLVVERHFQTGASLGDSRVAIEKSVDLPGTIRTAALTKCTPLLWERWVDEGAQQVMERLSKEWLLREELAEAVAAEPNLRDDVRRRAIGIAEQWPKDGSALNIAAWEVVKEPSRPTEDYLRALRSAQVASESDRDDGFILNTLGVAQYRAGEYEQAIQTLTRSLDLNAKANGGTPHPADVAFLAIAQHQLGRTDEARRLLGELRELAMLPVLAGNAEAQSFLREAEQLIEPSIP
jgi:tetratricopeptide (TPR) repeat protein